MVQVLDYSRGKPGAAAIAAAGYAGAVRYVGFPDRVKCTTAGELADYTAHGLGMALVYEDHADDWRGGHSAGRAAGARARNHANAIGFPTSRPIYMAVDRDVVSAAEFAAATAYLAGAAETLGGAELTGVYGEHDVCATAHARGVASWFWQTRAWSGTPPRMFPYRHLYQRVGVVRVGEVDCDINDVAQTDWGQHNGEGTISWNTEIAVPEGPNKGVLYPAADMLAWTNYYANLIPALLEIATKTLQAVTGDEAVTADLVKQSLEEAVARHAPTAEQVAEAQRPFLVDLIREVVPEEQADLLVDALARRLATPPPAPAGSAPAPV